MMHISTPFFIYTATAQTSLGISCDLAKTTFRFASAITSTILSHKSRTSNYNYHTAPGDALWKYITKPVHNTAAKTFCRKLTNWSCWIWEIIAFFGIERRNDTHVMLTETCELESTSYTNPRLFVMFVMFTDSRVNVNNINNGRATQVERISFFASTRV